MTAYCNTSFSFDTARCCLLFYDWYMQKEEQGEQIIMEFYQVINSRRTVRNLTTEHIPVDVLERIIAAGIQAPTHDHGREWEFVILREEEEKENALQFVKAFAEAQGENRFVSASASPQQKMYADAMPKQYSMLAKSGCGGACLLYWSWLSRKRRCRFRAGGTSSNKHAAFWQMVKRR